MSISVVLVTLIGNGGGILFSYLYHKPGGIALIISYASGQAIGALFLITINRKTLLQQVKIISTKKLFTIIKNYSQFPKYTVPHSLGSKGVIESPIFFLTAFFGSDVTGLFAITRRALNQPLNLIGKNVGKVFHRNIGGDKINAKENLNRKVKIILLTMLLLSAPIAFVIVLFGTELFMAIFGENFGRAALFAQILLPVFIMRMLATPVAHVFLVLNYQRLLMFLQFLHLSLVLLAYLYGYWTDEVTTVLMLHSMASSLAYGLIVLYALKISASNTVTS